MVKWSFLGSIYFEKTRNNFKSNLVLVVVLVLNLKVSNMGCVFRRSNFLYSFVRDFWVSSATLDALCSGSFCHLVKIYSFTLMHMISTGVVVHYGKHPTCQLLNVTLTFSQQTLGLSRKKEEEKKLREPGRNVSSMSFLTRQEVVQTRGKY